MSNEVILNCYPDSVGYKLSELVEMLSLDIFKNSFSHLYLLPSIYNSDFDRGFSVVDYNLNEELVDMKDVEALKKMNIALISDLVLNHMSINSPFFKDIIEKGDESIYRDFFVDWNSFWKDKGEISKEGYIIPDKKYIQNMYFRKNGFPVLEVNTRDNKKLYYWNTFYSKKINDNEMLAQMDVNSKSPLVWKFYEDTIEKLSSYGIKILRLDAFPYLSKIIGRVNFFNKPESYELLDRVKEISDRFNITNIPEIHEEYESKTYLELSEHGYIVYDYFLPGLMIDAIENKSGEYLYRWGKEILDKNIRTISMLSTHDGIAIKDIKGLLIEDRTKKLVEILIERGGIEKKIGSTERTYQVFITYFSALNEDIKKMEIARAIQMFFPGIPQVYYLDLFGGLNDYEAVKNATEEGTREINRTRKFIDDVKDNEVLNKQLDLIALRRNHCCFNDDASIEIEYHDSVFIIKRTYNDKSLTLTVDFEKKEYSIKE